MPLFVIGIFGDYDLHHLKSDLDLNVSSGPFSAHGEVSVNRQWSIGGRMGYLSAPSTLVFISAGYTNLSLSDFTASISANSPTGIFYASVPTVAGGFVGAGFETKLTKIISLRGEYRFTEFGSGLVTLPTINGTDLNTFLTARISPTLQIVKASLNFRF
jgi:outer membrane immunogenic protein